MKKTLTSLLLLLMTTGAWAQRTCGTMANHAEQLQQYPDMQRVLDDLEEYTAQYNHLQRSGEEDVVVIPVVFHIVHNGQPVGTGENLDEVYIHAQLAQMNADFALLNSDAGQIPGVFAPASANTKIQFALAQRTPSCEPTTGIVRYNGGRADWTSAQINSQLKPATIWNRDLYLNVWTVRFNASNNLLGYAQFPGGNAATDGVVNAYYTTGSIDTPHPDNPVYNKGRTMTHEVGHWLNLLHIWGDDECGNDLVADTPPHQEENYGCPSFPHRPNNTCGSNANGEMFMNYMDYVNDNCMHMFTEGQSVRMNAVVDGGPRNSLRSSLGAVPIGEEPCVVTYCAAGASSSGFEKISRVQFANVDNSSSATAGYEDFTSVVATVARGAIQDVSVTISNGVASDQTLIWIDFDRNGVFHAVDELVFSQTGAGTRSGTIAIPAGALAGTTRMRVRLHDSDPSYGPNATPCGNSGYGQVEDYTVQIFDGWNGSESNDWSDANNWTSGAVPGENDDVLITADPSNQPNIDMMPDNPATCRNLVVNTGAAVTIAPGRAMTVTGNMTNNGSMTLQSNETGNGTIITRGTVGGSGTFSAQQYLTGSGGATPDGRHWYVAPTVAGATSAAYSAAGNNRLWAHDEAQEVTGANGTGWTEITDDVTALTPMRGYAARLGGTETVVYSGGTFNTGDMSLGGLTRTGTGSGRRGYQLVANPYPSFLDWGDVYAASTDLLPTIWYRTQQGGSMVFATYNALLPGLGLLGATEHLHPGQAFWVRVNEDGNTGTANFTDAMRNHRASETMRSGGELVRLTLTNGQLTDEALIHFNDLASNDADVYDSEKQMSPAEVPQLWSNVEGLRMAINGLYSPESQPTVPLGIRVQAAGAYTISATELELMGDAWLEDVSTGAFQNLGSEPSYSFSSEGGTFQNRFVLHFSAQVVGLEEATSGINIFSFEKTVNIILHENSRGMATVMDMTGRIVHTAALQGLHTRIPLQVTSGIYVVHVETERGVETKRVLIAD
jgi:hypothetical protein